MKWHKLCALLCDVIGGGGGGNLFKALAFKYNLDPSKLSELIELAKMTAANPLFGDENRKKLGFSINDITSCQFNKVDCKNDLHWIWLYDYGNCFQFNSGLNLTNQKIDLVKSSRLDKGYGLILNFNFNYVIMRQEIPIGNDIIISEIQDFIVLIHNSSNMISSTTKFYFIKFISKKSLSFKRTLIYKQPSPYSDCIDLSSYSSVLYDYIKQSNYSYRQIDCLDLCIQQKIINECECYYLKYPDLNTQVKPCLNLTQYECANNEINTFVGDDCISIYCPFECTSLKYESENSIGSFYSDS